MTNKLVDEQALDSMMEQLDYLKWFKQNADFGPADGDVHAFMNEDYTKQTGNKVPDGWEVE